MAVKHAPAKHKAKAAPRPKPKPLTPEQKQIKELYPHERSPYKAIPPDKRGPGKLAPGHNIILQAWGVQLQVTAQLGANGAHVTGGYGNWNQVLVPRADPLTQWSGRNLITMDVDLVIDGYRHGRSVEPQIKALEALATRDPAMLTPPAIRIYGASAPPRAEMGDHRHRLHQHPRDAAQVSQRRTLARVGDGASHGIPRRDDARGVAAR